MFAIAVLASLLAAEPSPDECAGLRDAGYVLELQDAGFALEELREKVLRAKSRMLLFQETVIGCNILRGADGGPCSWTSDGGVDCGDENPAAVAIAAAQSAPESEPGTPRTPDAGDTIADAPLSLPDAGSPPAQRETLVTAPRMTDLRRIAGSAQIIGREELERRESNDINRVLQGVPGVYLREEDGQGLRPNIGLRGGNPDRSSKVSLLEDGVLFGPAPYSAPAAYYFPMVTRMTAVEIYKGPAVIRFGPQTIGGAVNLRTKEIPTGFAADLDTSLGNFKTAKAHGSIGWGDDRFGVLAEGLHLQSEGFKQLDGGGNTGFDKNEVMIKARYAFLRGEQVRSAVLVKLGYADETSNETYLGLSEADFKANPLRRYAITQNDQMKWSRLQAELTHVLELGDAFTLRTTFYRHDFDRTWNRVDSLRNGPALYDVLTGPEVGVNAVYLARLRGEEEGMSSDDSVLVAGNRRTFVSQGVQSIATLQLPELGPLGQELEVGFRYHHDQIARHHTSQGFLLTRGAMVPDERGVTDALINTAWTRALAFHLQDQLSLGRLLVVPGARVEIIQNGFIDRLAGTFVPGQQVVPSFGIGAVYGLPKGFDILAGAYQGFSPVSPGQAPNVQPERAWNYEAGARFHSRRAKIELIGFLSDYFNLSGECTFSSGCLVDSGAQFNGGAVWIGGLEALASARVAGPLETELFADLSYTLTIARFKEGFSSRNPVWGRVEAFDELPYIPTHQAAVRLRLQRGPFDVGLGGTVLGAMRELAGQGEGPDNQWVPTRVLLDLTAGFDVAEAARIYFTANNLLNQPQLAARRPFGARPIAPFTAQLGFKYAFR